MSDFSTYEVTMKVTMKVSAYDASDAVDVAIGILLPVDGVQLVEESKQLEHSMSAGILAQTKQAAFTDGVCYALEEIRSVYGDGVKDTDIWAEHMLEENN
jgi:hypothetical protein